MSNSKSSLRKRCISKKLNKTNQIKHETCAICLEEQYDKNEDATSNCALKLHCGHTFHIKCIFAIQGKWRCPMCKKAINAIEFFNSLQIISTDHKKDERSEIHTIMSAMNFAYASGAQRFSITYDTPIIPREQESSGDRATFYLFLLMLTCIFLLYYIWIANTLL
jgi:hypothetical protein